MKGKVVFCQEAKFRDRLSAIPEQLQAMGRIETTNLLSNSTGRWLRDPTVARVAQHQNHAGSLRRPSRTMTPKSSRFRQAAVLGYASHPRRCHSLRQQEGPS